MSTRAPDEAIALQELTVGDVPLRYRVDGPEGAPPVLFLNSLGTSAAMWAPQVERLAGSHRLVTFEARGQAGTAAPPPPYAIADLAGDALGLLDHLGIGRAHVVGVSLGGMVALWLAAHRPDRLLTATYADTAVRVGTAEAWQERIDTVRQGGMGAVRERVMGLFFSPRFHRDHPGTVAGAAQVFEAHDPEGYVGHCTVLRDTDLGPDIARIAVPSLVIVGADDVSTPPGEARAIAEQIEGATLVVLPDAGHLANLEQPDAFTEAVRRHVGT